MSIRFWVSRIKLRENILGIFDLIELPRFVLYAMMNADEVEDLSVLLDDDWVTKRYIGIYGGRTNDNR